VLQALQELVQLTDLVEVLAAPGVLQIFYEAVALYFNVKVE
jgi:hypothetical protein